MNRSTSIIAFCLSLLLLPLTSSPAASDDKIHVTILHFNDIYEITPVSGGKEGGLARVATLYKQLKEKNPNTFMTLGGDLFSPSAMGTARVDGKPLAGKQMVDVLNGLGLQIATFGNHEFDLKPQAFNERMEEAKFAWVSSNVFDAKGKPFAGVKKTVTLSFSGVNAGDEFRLGIFGLTLRANRPDYVSYTDPTNATEKALERLAMDSDFIVALTHQAIGDDEKLLQQFPAIDLLLGGHEHVNYQRWRGKHLTPLLKGDANVRTVYVIDIDYDPKTKQASIDPKLVKIDRALVEDAKVKARAEKWVNIAFDAFRKAGFNPDEVVTTTTDNLDGLEEHVRSRQTNLTQLIAKSLLIPYLEADLSLYNSGSIRIDDVLQAGQVTVYDIIRVMPFGGTVPLVEMQGGLLKKVLDQGQANIGTGGYLQSANTSKSLNGVWLIQGVPLNEKQTYKVAINEYLAAGKERNLEYLNPSNPAIKTVNDGEGTDIRKLLIQQLSNSNPD
ncbi:MAG: bifunctional metallophosphatase/5'-nucleotidase [Candidatus Thiodiazotropha sp.]